MSVCTSNIVISHPRNVTICEGEEAIFTCVLNVTITDHYVRWYLLRKDHDMPIKIGSNNRISYSVINETTTTLIVHDAAITLAGFYWVKTPNFNACNVSLNVLKGMCDNEVLLLHTYM